MDGQAQRLGRLIRNARDAKKFDQEKVARQVRIGTSTLRAIETGRVSGPSVYTILRLMSYLDIDPDELRPLMPPAAPD